MYTYSCTHIFIVIGWIFDHFVNDLYFFSSFYQQFMQTFSFMFVYIYVFSVHVCVCVWVSVHTCICVYTLMYTYAHTHIYFQELVSLNVCENVFVSLRRWVFKLLRVYVCLCMWMY